MSQCPFRSLGFCYNIILIPKVLSNSTSYALGHPFISNFNSAINFVSYLTSMVKTETFTLEEMICYSLIKATTPPLHIKTVQLEVLLYTYDMFC